ncbi:MAG: hypothetical protein CVU63_21800 [Deltaproteobacteria bacterium HGW-Deltaproteobacteria-20]|nr:MAG: hypothetical protein CVU63_21800 [Deltaproteobacteria bacterium HGW-Deltaproteobacteria-20]
MNRLGLHTIALLIVTGGLLCDACRQDDDVKPDPIQPAQNSSETGAQGLHDWACPPGTSGARMVLIETHDGRAYCIDERETAYAEYKQFVDAKGSDTSGQPEQCTSNDSFVPALDNPLDCLPEDWQIDTHPDRPVNCVDFCDAWSYCKWSGKRLCGIVGANNGIINDLDVNEFDEVGASAKSEWFNACSQGGTTRYPYGNEYQAGTCTDKTRVQEEGEEALNVRNTVDNECHGTGAPYNEVYDLSGGVYEWGNLCRQGSCAIQGGYYIEKNAEYLACDVSLGSAAWGTEQFATGIRCCADAVEAPRTETYP